MLGLAAAAATVASAAGVLQASIAEPTPEVLSQAVTQFLKAHGDLCMAKYTWPRDVTEEDRQRQTNDALQLPVLERLGVVRSEKVPDAAATPTADAQPEPAPLTQRYWLTQKGEQYYLKRERTTLGLHGEPEQHAADFCIASLTLDKVVKWAPPDDPKLADERIVSYTYHIKAADWMSDAGARQVFPIVDRIIRGAGKMTMTATVKLKDGQWVPVLPEH